MDQEQRLSEDQGRALSYKKRVFQSIGGFLLSFVVPSTILFGITPGLSPEHQLFAWLAGISGSALLFWICIAGVIFHPSSPKRPRPAPVEKQVKQESFSALEQPAYE